MDYFSNTVKFRKCQGFKSKPSGFSNPGSRTIDRKIKCVAYIANMAEWLGHFGKHIEIIMRNQIQQLETTYTYSSSSRTSYLKLFPILNLTAAGSSNQKKIASISYCHHGI